MTKKGYGQHSFLDQYIHENEVGKIMEIGVANGDNAKNMVETAQGSSSNPDIEYYGFDVFKKDRKRAVEKKLEETGCSFELFSGDSKSTLPELIERLPTVDLIFIGGGHDYRTVESDWKHSQKLMTESTGVFFHNYGYSGVRKVVDDISEDTYSVEILDPASDYKTALVKIR